MKDVAGPRLALGLIALHGFLLIACEADLLEAAPSAVCREAGVQCSLENGPLGVCERTQCPDDATDPCYACISQH